jgi:hypothetical protein
METVPVCAAPDLKYPELSLISYLKLKEKSLAFEPRTATGNYAEMRKLKNSTRKQNLKIKQKELKIYRMVSKTYVQIV